MTSLARVSTGLRLNRSETSRISIPFLVRFPPGSCSGVQRKIDTRIGQDARILSKIRFTTNVPFYYDPLYRCSLQVQRSLPGSLKNVSLCCCNLFSTLLFYFILTSFKNFTIFRCIHIRIYLSIYIGYLSPENLWVSSRCSMFLDPNVSYFFFFYVPIVSRHRTISLDEQFIFPLYRLALSCNYKYRSILDETSNAIRIEEIVKCWHAVSKLPAFRRRKTR